MREEATDKAGMRRHSPVLVLVHVVWATRRRCRWLEPCLDREMASILTKYAVRAGCDVSLVGAAFDHVHVLLRLTPSTTLASTVQRLKGGAAHEINLRGLLAQHLEWQAGYWAESVSPSDGRTARAVHPRSAHAARRLPPCRAMAIRRRAQWRRCLSATIRIGAEPVEPALRAGFPMVSRTSVRDTPQLLK